MVDLASHHKNQRHGDDRKNDQTKRPEATGDAQIGRDHLLTTITLYWVTGSITTSMRDYYDNRWHSVALGPDDVVTTPTAMAVFAHEFVPEGQPPREFYERLYNIERWTVFPRGGHFAAAEVPDLLAGDIRAHFDAVLTNEPGG